MEDSLEPSSSLSFTSSSLISNGSTSYNISTQSVPEGGSSLEIISLAKLSASLEQLVVSSSTIDYSDADIVVEDVSVGVHRCILASRSQFFYELFKKDKDSMEKESRPKYYMKDMLPYGSVGHEAFLIFLSYLYTGKLKPCPPEVSTCVDDQCIHHACRPAINFSVDLMYASAIFQVPELVSLFQVCSSSTDYRRFTQVIICIVCFLRVTGTSKRNCFSGGRKEISFYQPMRTKLLLHRSSTK